jgi:hypothetical protein
MIVIGEGACGWQDVRTKLTIASQKILRIWGIVIDLWARISDQVEIDSFPFGVVIFELQRAQSPQRLKTCFLRVLCGKFGLNLSNHTIYLA